MLPKRVEIMTVSLTTNTVTVADRSPYRKYRSSEVIRGRQGQRSEFHGRSRL